MVGGGTLPELPPEHTTCVICLFGVPVVAKSTDCGARIFEFVSQLTHF